MSYKRKLYSLDGDLEPSFKRYKRENFCILCSTEIFKEEHEVSEEPIHVALRQPHIIQKIFSYLGPYEVHQCGKVCSQWRWEAIRLLKKCPLKEDYKLLAQNFRSQSERLRKWQQNDILDKLTKENLNVSEHPCSSGLFPEYCPICNWWFFFRGDTIQCSSSLFEIYDKMECFSQSDMGCVPSFSFICLDESFNNAFISPKCPTLLLYQPRRMICEEFSQKILHKLNELIDQDWFYYNSSEPKKFSEAFHINRYTSDLRVIITDWSNPGTSKSNLEIVQFPIKSLFLLTRPGFDDHWSSWLDLLDNFLEKSNFVKVSGGIMKSKFPIVYHAPGYGRLQPANAITIAFMGENVQSSACEISFTNYFTRRLDALENARKFRRSLNFPTDDGRVFGFIFELCREQFFSPEDFDSFINQIDRVFSGITLYRISLLKMTGDDFISPGFSAIDIHIIRF